MKKAPQNLADIETYENIPLIQVFIYIGNCKILSKGHETVAIYHNLLLQGLNLLQCDDFLRYSANRF